MAFYFLCIGLTTAISLSLFKFKNIIIGVIIGILLVIKSSNMPYYVSDYIVYQTNYNLRLDTMEPGYEFISGICYQLGMSYQTFRTLLIFFFFIIMIIALILLKTNVGLFLSLYAIFPFFVDAIQMRILGVVSFLVLATAVYKSNLKFKILLTELAIIGAAMFHSIAYIFILFPIIKILKDKFSDTKALSILIVLELITGFIIKTFSNVGFISVVANFIQELSGRDELADTLTSFYTSQQSLLWIIIWWIIMVLFYVVVMFMYNHIPSEVSEKSILEFPIIIIILSSVAIPLIVVSGTYSRIYRIAFVMSFLILSQYLVKGQNKIGIKLIIIILYIIAFIGSIDLIYSGNVFNQIPMILS